MSESRVVLIFPAKADYLLLARLALSGVARGVAIDDEVLGDLKLAVTEACGNAVRHAYGPAGGDVTLTFIVRGEQLEVVVADEGKGIRLGAGPEREPSADGQLEGGMGMPIIRAIVDELAVGDGPDGRGTVVRMVKDLSPA